MLFPGILTAFYNVRNGSYGPLTKGNYFKINPSLKKGTMKFLFVFHQSKRKKFSNPLKDEKKRMNCC